MIKKIIEKAIYKYKASSETYISYLKSIGVEVGENVKIFVPHHTTIDVLNPHLLSIGNNVAITGPVSIFTHDYSIFVANNLLNGDIVGKQKPVIIGNNIFLGWGCTILPGTIIEDNTIIGAGAVVSGHIRGGVYGGNPAKQIMNIETYISKRKSQQLEEAINIFKNYYQRYNIYPDKNVFHEYFYLFTNNERQLTDLYKKKMNEFDYNKCLDYLNQGISEFNSYEDFVQYAIQSLNREGSQR